jgi:hypothetical protein
VADVPFDRGATKCHNSGMLTTYQALLRDNRLEWQSDAPQILPADRAVKVFVTVLDDQQVGPANRGERMAAALEQLAKTQAVAELNAAEWEREARSERPLPGRD